MPELPEAETLARHMAVHLTGRTVERIRHLRSDMVRSGAAGLRRLAGASIVSVGRRGKRVIIDFGARGQVVIALGMSGHLCVVPGEQPVAKHTHWRVSLRDTDLEMRFRDVRRFGWIEWHGAAPDGNGSSLHSLGVEPLSLTAAGLRRVMARRRQVKALLMDQSAIAGLGNIYCDEALHRAGIHPLEIAADVDPARIGRLCRAIKTVLRGAISANGSTIRSYVGPEGGPGSYQARHRVYGREGEPCRKCRVAIVRIQAAGRSTHFCPACQQLSFQAAAQLDGGMDRASI